MKTATKNYREVETADHIWRLDRISDYFFQETYFSVWDVIGDYYETFNSYGEAAADFEKMIMED
jgi:hypothetical protein